MLAAAALRVFTALLQRRVAIRLGDVFLVEAGTLLLATTRLALLRTALRGAALLTAAAGLALLAGRLAAARRVRATRGGELTALLALLSGLALLAKSLVPSAGLARLA